MSGARKVVTEVFPAAELPSKLLGDIDPHRRVRITLEELPDHTIDGDPRYLRYWGAAAHLRTTSQEAVARIRELRDEWD